MIFKDSLSGCFMVQTKSLRESETSGLMLLKLNGEYSDERLLRHRDGHECLVPFSRPFVNSKISRLDRIILSYAQISNTCSVDRLK